MQIFQDIDKKEDFINILQKFLKFDLHKYIKNINMVYVFVIFNIDCCSLSSIEDEQLFIE